MVDPVKDSSQQNQDPSEQRPSISRRETCDFTQIFHASVTLCDWLRSRLAPLAKM